MSQPVSVLPSRSADLVAWPAGQKGRFLVRNRANGESFEFGAEEHFLLERLDGRFAPGEIRRSFQEHFGEPLAPEELDDFLQLAAKRGLLQKVEPPAGCCGRSRAPPRSPGPLAHAGAAARTHSLWNRIAAQSLKFAATALRFPGRILSATAARFDMLRLAYLDYVPRADDIFIVTYPRSGTTWMQMIVYQLTTDGSMEFPHIAEYCPWFEKSLCSTRGFETRPSPRLFKSHLPWRKIPRGPCKYIYVARDGKDVAVSYFHLYRAYNGYDGTFDEFFDRFVRGKVDFGSWFEHVRGWWAHRHDPNVLFLTYEELSRDLEGAILRIAAFIGREPSATELPRIVERCGFGFMKQHEEQFDPVVESLWEQGVRLKSFLRHGKVGDGAVCLSGDQHAQFDSTFGRPLAKLGVPVVGHQSSMRIGSS